MPKVEEASGNAAIKVSVDELESRGGHGLEIAQVTVTGEDNKIQRFYVRLFDINGKITCRVTAVRLNLPQDKSASVQGAWFELRNPQTLQGDALSDPKDSD